MHLRKLFSLAGLASLSLIATASSRATDLSNSITGSVSDGTDTIPYRLFQPTVAPGQKVPLILFLHGMGDRGSDNVGQTYWMNELQKKTASGQYAAYVLAPQVPSGGWWSSTGAATSAETLTLDALHTAMANPNVDTSRIYVTGVSMGSFGTWDLLRRDTKDFAAAVPLSAGGDPSTASQIKTPVWAFHAADDPVVPVQTTRDMVAALQAAGGNVKYTELDSGGHYIWPDIYKDASNTLYSWLFSQQNGDASLVTTSPSDPVTDPTVPPDNFVGPVVHHASAVTMTPDQAAAAVPVPEPTLMGLVAMGGMMLFVRRNRVKC